MKRAAVVMAGAVWLGLAAPAGAVQSPEWLVGEIYASIGKPAAEAHYWLSRMMAPARRQDYFTAELVEVLQDTDHDEWCLEGIGAVDGNSFDPDEIHRTLVIEGEPLGEGYRVDACFMNHGMPNHRRFEFVSTPAGWRIADLLVPAEGGGARWRLSEVRC
ncbi:hypothetical protein QC820_11325 [Halomonas mongoliensis]|uniref:DUF3828 domain-containing protein n=1 Tax=Halomonas mongoliensis TaxID=321265 RepID=A0ABU1GPC6_9GAMM|nr:hypothetical protein [Halomonas mongoliensis]MDR5893402.1 hypothetical protein [Halomonas mongoliensis]